MITESEKEILLKQANSLMLNGKYEAWALEPFSEFARDLNCKNVKTASAKYRVLINGTKEIAAVYVSWNGDLRKWSSVLCILRDDAPYGSVSKSIDIFSIKPAET